MWGSAFVRVVWGEASSLVASSVLSAVILWTNDVAARPSVRRPAPLLMSSALGVADGAATGIAFVLAIWLPARALMGLLRRIPGVSGAARVVPYAVAFVLAALGARQAVSFSSAGGGDARLLAFGLVAAVSLVAVIVVGRGLGAALAALTDTSRPRSRRGHLRTSAALVAFGAVFLGLERTVLASVGEAPYSFVEGLTHVAFTLAFTPLLAPEGDGPDAEADSRHPRLASLVAWLRESVASAAIVWLVLFVGYRPVRTAIEHNLPAVWEEPVYASRWLRRSRQVQALAGDHADARRLASKYELDFDRFDDGWTGASVRPLPGPDEPDPFAVDDPSLLDAPKWNVVVVFVDTLRADVAHDPEVMPQLGAWMKEDTLELTRAYATGSSTLLTLVPMLGCRYDAKPADRPMVLDVAKRAGLTTSLVIPKTASEYHKWAYPGLVFDREEIVPDFDGRRIPTADALVDRSLTWLREERPDRFFLWLYHFDVHSWADLDDEYVERHAKQARMSKNKGLHWRYRAAARGVDESFTRLRKGLEELGLADRTVIVFVSDHGEALGQKDFWAHSTYLWESLIRVPMAIHVPGEPARAVDTPVSTIDVGTTLMPFMRPRVPAGTCHGIDLLDEREDEPRRPPVLFSSMVDGRLTRIGMLVNPERKLVLDLRDSDARLLRVRDGSSAEEDVSLEEPDELRLRLDQLIRAPVYPKP